MEDRRGRLSDGVYHVEKTVDKILAEKHIGLMLAVPLETFKELYYAEQEMSWALDRYNHDTCEKCKKEFYNWYENKSHLCDECK